MDPLNVIPFAFPGLERVGCAFTTRRGGFGQGPYAEGNMSFDVGDDPAAVRRNRESLLRLGFTAWVELTQVHGTRTLHEPTPTALLASGPLEEGDGLSTTKPGLALCVKTADCQPILLAHREGRFVAALHAGWRGNVQEYPQKAVAELCERYSAEPSELLAVRGPSLGPTASQFVNFDLEFGERFRPYFDPAARTMNLWRLARDQLVEAGLRPDDIFGLDLCTWTNPEFFSYRRERTTGRMASLIWIKS